MTLVFPDSLSNVYPRTAPQAPEILRSDNVSIQSIPSTGNPLYPISQDTALAFSVPDDLAAPFLAKVQELPNTPNWSSDAEHDDDLVPRRKGWVMRAATKSLLPSRSGFSTSARNAWTGFVDLLKVSRPTKSLRAYEKAK